MLSDYPIKIGTVDIPYLSTLDESYEAIETVTQTEAGTDVVQVNRDIKLTVKIGGTVTSSQAKIIESLSRNAGVYTVQIYDLINNAYKSRQMRIRNYTCSLVSGSHKLSSMNGVWKISFDLVEM